MLTFGSLFAGIGGFDLGLERAGMVCKWQVEIAPFCQKVLEKHWPDVRRYGDVRECGKHNLEAVDFICGGFPCQPFSEAGEQRGEQDDRNLWPEMRRVIAEIRPGWVVAENVPGIRNIYLDAILSDLDRLDYTAGTLDIPAIAFGAVHIRHRIFIVANANRSKQRRWQWAQWGPNQRDTDITRNGTQGIMADTEKQSVGTRLCEGKQAGQWGRRFSNDGRTANAWAIEPDVGRVADGVPNRVDRLRALGNAVVPQVAEWIGRRIMEVEGGQP